MPLDTEYLIAKGLPLFLPLRVVGKLMFGSLEDLITWEQSFEYFHEMERHYVLST